MSWLCPTELDRRRVVDTSDRVRKARTFGAACAGIGILVLAPLLSWWLVPIFAVAAIILGLVDPGMRRSEHPERVAADRKSTRMNSSHVKISYAVFCLKKK